MKKRSLLLLLPLLALTSCDFSSVISFKKNEPETNNEINENIQNSPENPENLTENSTNTTTTNTTTETGNENTLLVPTNTALNLDEWQNFSFNDGTNPEYANGWNFYYGSTLNPPGQLWGTGEHSGVEFKKNSQIISPKFNKYKKIEIRFNFWFSSHESSSYKGTDGQPQFILTAYNENDKSIETTNISIARSSIPNNNTTLQITKYLYEDESTYFILKWNNYIPNGSGGYSAILCNAALKGWDYD